MFQDLVARISVQCMLFLDCEAVCCFCQERKVNTMSNYVINQGDVQLHLSDVFTVGFKQN